MYSVIVATGLMAFVDDCIKIRWHRRDRFTFTLPLPFTSPKSKGSEHPSPKSLINGMFGRKAHLDRERSPLHRVATEA